VANPRVLVVDDHAEARERIATLLKSEFDVVATVADGQAAIEATRALHPDAVVLDIAMPVLNGFEAAAIINDLPDAPRIVFSTAYDDPEFAEAAHALGASAFVLKRNMLVELVPAVRRALTDHAVCFYEDAQALSRTVARFIGGGLVANQPAVLVTTRSHRAAILEQLTAMAVDPQRRIEEGDLVMLDAEEVLSRVMVDDMPDAPRCEATMDLIVGGATGCGKRPVRVYGEMVGLLWKNGRAAAAVSLETQWNHFIARHKCSCSFLCAYSLDDVRQGAGFKKICDQHSHVVPADSPPPH
jgi:CheY-like chemotaxis protein